MANIQVLDKDTINKIAAGEVVERPSSVAKELIENAIDAGASAITVEIKEGGISFIRITDNGSGIEGDQIKTAFLRHATSKISSIEDLLTASSLGFRGEALSSIAAVAQVEVMTKTRNALTGIRYVINGEEEVVFETIGCPEGTTMIIRNLFYNTPARRKFLKTPGTEAGYIGDLVERLAMSHPDISFKFINNNQNKLHTSGNTNLKDIIYNIYGREITSNLLAVSGAEEDMTLSGFVGKPSISRGNRTCENYFINGRYIKSTVITKAIEEAYKTFVMVHRYPFTALHFTIDSSHIDVNVHPTKMEIRFNNNQEVYKFVYETVKAVLSGRELIPKVALEKTKDERPTPPGDAPEPFELQRLAALGSFVGLREKHPFKTSGNTTKSFSATKTQPVQKASQSESTLPKAEAKQALESTMRSSMGDYTVALGSEIQQPTHTTSENTKLPSGSADLVAATTKLSKETKQEDTPRNIHQAPEVTEPGVQLELFEDQGLLSEAARPKHKLIGQLFDTYWIVEYRQQMFIIDQHAAHEKVLYEKIVRGIKEREITSQYISPPVILPLSLSEINTLETYIEHFTRLGFEIEPFGGKEYAVYAVPSDLFGMTGKEMFVELLDSLASEVKPKTPEAIDDRLATMACKAAVKGNTRLSVKEADALIDLLLQAENPYTCPHGRPTIIAMTKYELEKKFKRIV